MRCCDVIKPKAARRLKFGYFRNKKLGPVSKIVVEIWGGERIFIEKGYSFKIW